MGRRQPPPRDHDQEHVVYGFGDNSNNPTQVFSSKDDGQTWQNCSTSSAGNVADSDSGLAIDPQDSSTLYLGLQGAGVLVSRNGCATWQNSSSGLGNLFINSLATDLNRPGLVYVATGRGAYASYDSGKSWGLVSDGIPNMTAVYSITVDPQSNVYASTPDGVFQLGKK